MEPYNLVQALKIPDWVNLIKGNFSIYEKIAFGILADTFPRDNLTSTTLFLCSVLAPSIKNITNNIYRYFPFHFSNVGPQVKGIDFENSSSTVLAEFTIYLVVSVDSAYQLTVLISGATNSFHNHLTASYELYIIYLPPHYVSWFKFRFPDINIKPAPDVCYVV